MILIGQYDSPYVRRVGIALTLYGIPFEHQTWSAWSETDKVRRYNPFGRVPTLVLDDGDVLIESHIMLDYVDSLVPAEQAMFPRSEPARHKVLKVAALATGLADKAVSLYYEQKMHDRVSELWAGRCREQIAIALQVLEADRAGRTTDYWFGDRIGHADIAVAVALRFIADVHSDIPLTGYEALGAHVMRLEALPVFQEISQPFVAPA